MRKIKTITRVGLQWDHNKILVDGEPRTWFETEVNGNQLMVLFVSPWWIWECPAGGDVECGKCETMVQAMKAAKQFAEKEKDDAIVQVPSR